MDHAAYHVLYVDSRISQQLDGRYIRSERPGHSGLTEAEQLQSWEGRSPDSLESILGEIEEIRINLERLLARFNGGK